MINLFIESMISLLKIDFFDFSTSGDSDLDIEACNLKITEASKSDVQPYGHLLSFVSTILIILVENIYFQPE